jgi:L-serine dehydratase
MGKHEFVSIFNDVIGPVMRGPSSSHTAGAYRIAKIACSLFGGVPESVRCTFDPAGSYAPTYLPLGVDKAFCAGIIGMDMLDPEYDAAVEIARRQLRVEFAIAPLAHSDHPNTAKVELSGKNAPLTLWARSTGGGIVDIFRLDEWPVEISGKHLDAVVRCSGAAGGVERLRSFVQDNSVVEWLGHADSPHGPAAQVRVLTGSEDDLAPLSRHDEVEEMWTALPVFFPERGTALVHSGSDMAGHAKATGVSLGEIGLAYECQLLGLTEEQAIDEMSTRYDVMRRSVADGLDSQSTQLAWLKPHAADVLGKLKRGALPFGTIHTRAAARALAAMHTCNSRGIVCAAPTGGSAGVLPGVLMTLEDELSLDRDAVVRALFAAGAVGLVMAIRATFAAETAGCQVEIGIAGAMAAAAAVEAAGGAAEHALNAAAISLQNTMGSVCDPVGGGCEIPCHSRNALAASAAFTNADLILGGYPNPIPLDETVDASFDVGRKLPTELRCTALGGIAVTPSALALVNGEDGQEA